ncbi:MAG: PQQ-binding-like beta-propeller repeat protein, partial [Planctomycetota bacterium]
CLWGVTLLAGASVLAEQVGAPWTAFRSGPSRQGAVPGAKGPLDSPRTLWNYTPAAAGRIASIDSSPAVVGNRAYFGMSAQSPFRKSGAILCLDTDTGAEVWKYTGEGLEPGLQPVFSSPAVGGKFTAGGGEGKYLVCGEGYHDERGSRIFCLDLEPVTASGGKEKPKLHWARQTTSHAECSPCIFEGKAYAGSGDDGMWCMELETGRLLWHLEGEPFCFAKKGTQAEALAKLAGKTVAACGTAERLPPAEAIGREDPSYLVLEVKEFVEINAPHPALSPEGRGWGEGDVPANLREAAARKDQPLRLIVGKVALADAVPAGVEGASPVKIEAAANFLGCDSSPVVVRVPTKPGDAASGAPRLFFGNGRRGQAVVCVNAETGQLIWRTPTPYPAFSDPTVCDDKVLIGLSNGTFDKSASNPAGAVWCLSALDGEKKWEVKTSDGIIGAVPVSKGVAYACCRDGYLYIIDVAAGKLLKIYSAGATMVCSPAVTDDAVYMATDQGKIFCVKRPEHSFLWSVNLTPGQAILSSPAIAEKKLFVGSYARGLFCLAETPGGATAKKAKLWFGLGGDAARSGCADDRGPPSVKGDKARCVHDANTSGDTSQLGRLFPTYDSTRGGRNYGELAGMPCLAHDLIFIAVKAPQPRLLCLDEGTDEALFRRPDRFIAPLEKCLIFLDEGKDATLWSADLPAAPLGPATVCGDKVFVGAAGKDGGLIFCRRLTDGSKVWDSETSEAPASYIAASAGYLAFATANGKVLVLKAETGEETQAIPVGPGVQAPAIAQNTVIVAATDRAGAFDAMTGSWLWNFDEQEKMGRVLAPPVISQEAVWLKTEKLGIIGIGQREALKEH